jgi:ferritin-like protein
LALKKIKKIGFDSEKVKEDLLKNKHNKMTAFYYLILKQMLRDNSPS